MLVYCGNNPASRVYFTGQFWSGVINGIGNTMAGYAPIYAEIGSMAVADGPLLFGDAIAVVGSIALTAIAIGVGIYQATQSY